MQNPAYGFSLRKRGPCKAVLSISCGPRDPSSEQLRREAEELRATAKRLIKEAAELLQRSLDLEKKISRNSPKAK
jgi:hypothetical protein